MQRRREDDEDRVKENARRFDCKWEVQENVADGSVREEKQSCDWSGGLHTETGFSKLIQNEKSREIPHELNNEREENDDDDAAKRSMKVCARGQNLGRRSSRKLGVAALPRRDLAALREPQISTKPIAMRGGIKSN